MWDLIVSVPDHCLSFYFTLSIRITDVSLDYNPRHVYCRRHSPGYLLN